MLRAYGSSRSPAGVIGRDETGGVMMPVFLLEEPVGLCSRGLLGPDTAPIENWALCLGGSIVGAWSDRDVGRVVTGVLVSDELGCEAKYDGDDESSEWCR